MTNDEAVQIKGETVEELGALRQRTVCLHSKLERYLSAIEQSKSHLEVVLGRSHTFSTNDTSFAEGDAWPSHDALVDTCNDYLDAKKRIRILQEKLRQWGALD